VVLFSVEEEGRGKWEHGKGKMSNSEFFLERRRRRREEKRD
jgi:hypothetical protein